MTFEDTLIPILNWEGGYVNDKDDPGGATNKGITQAVYDSYRAAAKTPQRSVLYIQNEEYQEIYYQNYWREGKCDLLPVGVSLVHFDFCVNAGINRAAKTLQKVVSVDADGQIGVRTLDAVSKMNPQDLVHAYSQARRDFYNGLASSKPKLAKFVSGWLKRVADIERRAIRALGGPAANSSTS